MDSLDSRIERWNISFMFDAAAAGTTGNQNTDFLFSVLFFRAVTGRLFAFPIIFDVAIKRFSTRSGVPFDSNIHSAHTMYLVFCVCCFHIKCGFPRQRRWWWFCCCFCCCCRCRLPFSKLLRFFFWRRKLNSPAHSLCLLTAFPISLWFALVNYKITTHNNFSRRSPNALFDVSSLAFCSVGACSIFYGCKHSVRAFHSPPNPILLLLILFWIYHSTRSYSAEHTCANALDSSIPLPFDMSVLFPIHIDGRWYDDNDYERCGRAGCTRQRSISVSGLIAMAN